MPLLLEQQKKLKISKNFVNFGLMNRATFENLLKRKITDFVTTKLKGRYKEIVSDQFIIAYLVDSLTEEHYRHQKLTSYAERPEYWLNAAYKASITLFEHLLEHKCGAHGNGHHVAQDFSAFFKDFKPDTEMLVSDVRV